MKTSRQAGERNGRDIGDIVASLALAQRDSDRFAEAKLICELTRAERGAWLVGRKGLGLSGLMERVRFGRSECWYWVGTIDRLGYGWAGKTTRAHRYSWRLFNGEIPDGACVLHRCDVRSCVNPEHLFLGTQRENIADMDAKGRRAPPRSGESNNKAKLTGAAVREVRARYALGMESCAAIAIDFGVSGATIYDVVSGKTWRHS